MITVAEQKELLKRYGFDDGDPLLDWLNAAMREIESTEDWPWLEVLTTVVGSVGDNFITLPTPALKVISLRDTTNNQKLDRYERTRFEREIWDPTISGKSQIYVETGMTTIQIYPVADTAVTWQIVYQQDLVDLDDTTISPPIPETFHYPMVLCAAYTALMAENEEERAQAALKQFQDAMDKRMKKYGGRTLDEPEQVVDAMRYR